MKEIKATNGDIIQVDDKDYELAIKYSWYSRINCKTKYAHTKGIINGIRRWFYLHQLIMGTVGTKLKIDHCNHNGLDNRRDNLRICSHSDNIKNRRKHRGASKYTGVSKHLYNKWLCRININGKQKHIGLFDSEIDAAKAYNKAAIETGNQFYNLNDL